MVKSGQQLLKFERQHHSCSIQIFIKVLAQGPECFLDFSIPVKDSQVSFSILSFGINKTPVCSDLSDLPMFTARCRQTCCQ